MTMTHRSWLQSNTITFMGYEKFYSMMRCVGCKKQDEPDMAFLRCGHFSCSKCLGTLLVKCPRSTQQQAEVPEKYRCPRCLFVTTSLEIKEMKEYTRRVTWLHQSLKRFWKEGDHLRIFCDRCQSIHVAESRKSIPKITDTVNVCMACEPPKFLCRHNCAAEHEQIFVHSTQSYLPKAHEWAAAFNCVFRRPEVPLSHGELEHVHEYIDPGAVRILKEVAWDTKQLEEVEKLLERCRPHYAVKTQAMRVAPTPPRASTGESGSMRQSSLSQAEAQNRELQLSGGLSQTGCGEESGDSSTETKHGARGEETIALHTKEVVGTPPKVPRMSTTSAEGTTLKTSMIPSGSSKPGEEKRNPVRTAGLTEPGGQDVLRDPPPPTRHDQPEMMLLRILKAGLSASLRGGVTATAPPKMTVLHKEDLSTEVSVVTTQACVKQLAPPQDATFNRASLEAGPSEIQRGHITEDLIPSGGGGQYSEKTNAILKDIQNTLQLLVTFERCQDKTSKYIKLNVPVLDEKPNEEVLRKLFPHGDTHTIQGEYDKASVAFRYASHLIILKTLIYLFPHKLDDWRHVIEANLSLPSLMEFCFPVWKIPMRTNHNRQLFTYVVPFYRLSPSQRLERDVREVLANGLEVRHCARIPHTVPEAVMGVVIAKFNGANRQWVPTIKKKLMHKRQVSTDPEVPGCLNMVKVADNLFAVSTEKDVSLVRKTIDGRLLTYKISPDGMGQYGCGLWWNGTSLFATSVGTKPIAVWDFNTTNEGFVVHFSLQPICSENHSLTRNTLVEVGGDLCFAYGVGQSRLRALQYYKLIGGYPVKHNFPVIPFGDLSLLNVSTSLPYVIIRDSNVRTPALYLFSKVGDTKKNSWVKIDFDCSFSPAVVENIWFESDRLCLKLRKSGAYEGAQFMVAKIRLT